MLLMIWLHNPAVRLKKYHMTLWISGSESLEQTRAADRAANEAH